MIKTLKYPILFLFVTLVSCQSDNKDDYDKISEAEPTTDISDVSSEMALAVIEHMPSPLEMTALIQKTGISYSASILNNSANFNKYVTNSQRALNFGVYTTDLGYINMYNSSQDAISYLNALNALSQELNISQFFNFELMERLALNNKNTDSLMHISTQSMEKISDHLVETHRGDLGALIVAGGWVEGIYLACEVDNGLTIKQINDKIADQKSSLESLITLMEAYKANESVNMVLGNLYRLQKVYNKIEVVIENQDVKVMEENGTPIFRSNKKITVKADPKELEDIRKIVKQLRAKLVNQ
jgi:hypothetical protein